VEVMTTNDDERRRTATKLTFFSLLQLCVFFNAFAFALSRVVLLSFRCFSRRAGEVNWV
jgi:hypothetical protein